MPAAVASRYARALVDVVLAPSAGFEPDRVRQDLRGFEQALASSDELSLALESPSISRSRKRAVIGRLAESLSISKVAKNFLLVLIDHRRMSELSGIIDAFEKLVDERRGILQVQVVAARELEQPQEDDLKRQLEAMTGKTIGLNVKVDGDLVGGLVVRLGSTVYDGSVRGQLEAIGRQLRAD
jgi:F-type H+-transporting ATPase subunit delta